MSPLTAREMARRFIAREQASAGAPADGTSVDVTAAPERATRRLWRELTAWFGPYAVDALVTRALDLVQAEHPGLVAARTEAPLVSDPCGELIEHMRVHGATAFVAATTAILAALIEVLGRLIGDHLAESLIDQIGVGGDTNTLPPQGRVRNDAEWDAANRA